MHEVKRFRSAFIFDNPPPFSVGDALAGDLGALLPCVPGVLWEVAMMAYFFIRINAGTKDVADYYEQEEASK